ncbi:MAG: YIP1 family protein [Betaproteobacteria bacterium]|nr:YIP1 family protein [Betaproteobacteria bacterium]
MALIDRVKNILLTPKTEWPVIAGETGSGMDLLKSYAAPLIALGAACGFIGLSIIGVGAFGFSYRVGILPGLVMMVLQVVLGLVGVVILAHIIDALAPTFAGTKNIAQAHKVAVYSLTAAWLGGVFQILPMLGVLGILASLYSCYLLYLGLPALMKCPEDKAIPYTVVVIIVAIVLMAVISLVVGSVAAIGGARSGFGVGALDVGNVRVEKGSPAEKLDNFAKKMEEAGKKMEAAQKSGKPEEAMAAAMGGLASALGGKAAEPVGIDQLKPLVPETFAGLPKKSSRAEKAGALGFMVSEAEARYGDDGGKGVTLKVTDTGGAAGLMTLASWVQGEREDENGRERTYKDGNRTVHEKARKDGRNEYALVIAERFVVSAKGQVELAALKSAVGGLDLGKLESMKNEGVSK